ncbi:hypothetical protein E9M_03549 [Moraxella catarrhalis 46P47B1]|nr:hypothetical protein E9M_03549 [Moraxella catarrhalis 46P47B1]EGE19003.1 hypothetical protein E9Q_02838 [Moraxella catarrhalis BC1]
MPHQTAYKWAKSVGEQHHTKTKANQTKSTSGC